MPNKDEQFYFIKNFVRNMGKRNCTLINKRKNPKYILKKKKNNAYTLLYIL